MEFTSYENLLEGPESWERKIWEEMVATIYHRRGSHMVVLLRGKTGNNGGHSSNS